MAVGAGGAQELERLRDDFNCLPAAEVIAFEELVGVAGAVPVPVGDIRAIVVLQLTPSLHREDPE